MLFITSSLPPVSSGSAQTSNEPRGSDVSRVKYLRHRTQPRERNALIKYGRQKGLKSWPVGKLSLNGPNFMSAKLETTAKSSSASLEGIRHSQSITYKAYRWHGAGLPYG